MRTRALKFNFVYPCKCNFCPKILNSKEQEDKHFKKHHNKQTK